ncbi:hypothetical protein DJ71_24370 [Halorubrum sp. E3]|nr:hypothetical protein DJ71_24370 [Halorubrum sp. E3]OYR84368.1 hypothetical protein DJ72_05720 [Halorubrum distributum]
MTLQDLGEDLYYESANQDEKPTTSESALYSFDSPPNSREQGYRIDGDQTVIIIIKCDKLPFGHFSGVPIYLLLGFRNRH